MYSHNLTMYYVSIVNAFNVANFYRSGLLALLFPYIHLSQNPYTVKIQAGRYTAKLKF